MNSYSGRYLLLFSHQIIIEKSSSNLYQNFGSNILYIKIDIAILWYDCLFYYDVIVKISLTCEKKVFTSI